MSMNWIEILGYLASALVALSLTMSSIAKLRAVNLVGAMAFALYGGLVGAYPVMVVNGFIAVINTVFLLRMQPGRSEAFDLLPLARSDNRYFRKFLEYHGEEIGRMFPGFQVEALKEVHIVFILRNMLPVGVVVCRRSDPTTLEVLLDYVIPSDRDFLCAKYFYRSWNDVIEGEGVTRFLTKTQVDPHRKYLKKMNFVPDAELGPDVFVRAA